MSFIPLPDQIEIKNDTGNPVPVSGPLTDTQLRASNVNVLLHGTGLDTTPKTITVGDGCAYTRDYVDSIAVKKITGHETYRLFGERIGITNVVTGNDIWEGAATTIPVPSFAGEQMCIKSTSVNDTLAGSGVQKVDIHYITPAGDRASVIVSLDGTNEVVIPVAAIRFVNSIHTHQANDWSVAAGTITVYKQGSTATVYNQISPGGNHSLTACIMVPKDYWFFVTDRSECAADNTNVRIRMRATSNYDDALINFFLYKDTSVLINSTKNGQMKIARRFPPLSIIKFTAFSVSNGAAASASCDGWLEPVEP